MDRDDAITALSAPNSYAVVRTIEPQRIAISVTAQKTNMLPIALVAVVCGLIGLFFGLYLLRNPKPGWQTLSVTPMKMILIGCLNLALSPLLALIHFINGPPRNVELEASSMMLKADRSIAGDRVISDYDIEEVLCLFNENNVLCIETRKGNSQLIAFGRQQINEAIAFLIAQHFWYPLEITVAKVSSGIGRRTVFMPRIDPPATSAHAAIVRALGLNQ